ncbi:MAG: tRNA (adenosine(37)-N6)-dimethylallyltransferase MiaA [Bacteroidia bacterium]
MIEQNKYLIVVTGPTASGKTALSIALAKAFQTEVISADSRQFFKEMQVGTARPTAEELEGIKHHFLGHISIHDIYNAGIFEKDALEVLDTIFETKNVAIVCGGSGMYVNALCYGLDELPKQDKELRLKLEELLKQKGIEALQEKLKVLDSEYYKMVDLQNPHRLMRAIEVCINTGIPYSQLRKGEKKERNFKILKIGIDWPREKLYERINQRVDLMFEQGLVEEAKKLIPFKNINALQTVGYRELFDYFEGKCTLEEAKELIKQNTRRFAKRQLTWFRKDQEIKWFKPEETNSIIPYLQTFIHA